MASKRAKLLQELGLLAEDTKPNPYGVLGLQPGFIHNLLREDPSGTTLRFITNGVARVLTRVYHSDNPKTGNDDRFTAIDDAKLRIDAASPDALLRWAKADGAATTAANNRLLEQREAVATRAAELVRNNIELGNHPQHFSQLAWSQGVLVQRKDTSVLIRPYADGGLQARQGQVSMLDQDRGPLDPRSQASDFHNFLRRYGSFGLEPGSKIATYIDENGRASILNADLGFLMDITAPVERHRAKRRRRLYQNVGTAADTSDVWSRSADPLLMVTSVPYAENAEGAAAQITYFPQRMGTAHKSGTHMNLTWDLSMEVAGSTNEDLFRKIRYSSGAVGAAAIAGANTRQASNHFGLVAIPTTHIIEHDAGYSPLIAPGSALLLYDEASRMPVVTDTQIVGMIGNGAAA
jgi:hypothetical protein